MNRALPCIPVVDVRDGGPPRHALENPAKARALRDSCLGTLPRAAHPLVPSFDRISPAPMTAYPGSCARSIGHFTGSATIPSLRI
jgi:hypothetical protein